MPAAPHPAGRKPRSGSRLPSQVVADNVKALREEVLERPQAYLAQRMRALGQQWTQSTVSQVELGTRHVNTDELVALAASLETSVPRLLSPETAVTLGHYDGSTTVDIGARRPLSCQFVNEWLRDRPNMIWFEIVDGEADLSGLSKATVYAPEEQQP
jgi:transcriptional regulator with XRE-family HTH domain